MIHKKPSQPNHTQHRIPATPKTHELEMQRERETERWRENERKSKNEWMESTRETVKRKGVDREHKIGSGMWVWR